MGSARRCFPCNRNRPRWNCPPDRLRRQSGGEEGGGAYCLAHPWVRGLAEEIEVRIPEAQRQTDDEIAHRVMSVLRWDARIPSDRIHIEVEDDVVKLIGSVDWQFQKTETEQRIHSLAGVEEVNNRLVVRRSDDAPSDIKTRVEQAFRRHAHLHAAEITIQVNGHKVTLTGHVSNVNDLYTAENAAWSAAAVDEVDNQLLVRP
jgi:osmotically-inducible protein OsmY